MAYSLKWSLKWSLIQVQMSEQLMRAELGKDMWLPRKIHATTTTKSTSTVIRFHLVVQKK